MDIFDLFLTPVYIALIFGLARLMQPLLTTGLTKKYYYPALSLKIIGGISVGLIYQFYYGGGNPSGDTFRYFNNAKVIWEAFDVSPLIGLKLIFTNVRDDFGATFSYTSRMDTITDEGSYFVTRATALIGVFSFHCYAVIACFFAYISFIGMFLMFSTFVKVSPKIHKELAIGVLYMPSVFFWGSGVLKDTICMGALGLLFFSFYLGFIEKKNILSSLIMVTIGAVTLALVKVYILLCFLPLLVLWVFIQYGANIKNTLFKIISTPILIAVGGVASYYLLTNLTEGDSSYDIDKIGERAKITADYLYAVSTESGGSTYNIGTLDGSIGSMLALAPQAIVVSLFRPFLWEAKNPVMLLSALESTWFIYLTLTIIFQSGLIKIVRAVGKQPILILCFIYAFAFSIAIGVTSNNFGTLVRYKIPIMPFYIAGLYILRDSLAKRKAVAHRKKTVPNIGQTYSKI